VQTPSEATASKVGAVKRRRYDAPVRIALVSTYDHPTRDSIERMLTAAFPEYQIENFSVVDVLKRHRQWIAPNLWHVATEYGREIARRRLSLREGLLPHDLRIYPPAPRNAEAHRPEASRVLVSDAVAI